MKKILCSLMVIALLSAIASCSKDKDKMSSAAAIEGDWKFISISAKGQSTVSYKDPTDGSNSQIITNTDYTSTQNGGTVSFSPSAMTATGVTYTINSTAHAYSYVDGQLDDSVSSPFSFVYPATNSTSTYKIIGQDSIYFAGQSIVSTQDGSGGTTSPSGAKFSIAGNTLTITSDLVKDTVINYAGTILNQHELGKATLILQKQ